MRRRIEFMISRQDWDDVFALVILAIVTACAVAAAITLLLVKTHFWGALVFPVALIAWALGHTFGVTPNDGPKD